ENLEWLELNFFFAACHKLLRRTARSPNVGHAIRASCSGRQLERPTCIQKKLLRVIARIAQRHNSLLWRPGRPSVDFEFAGIAANPVRVAKNVRIVSRPLRSSREHIPVL